MRCAATMRRFCRHIHPELPVTQTGQDRTGQHRPSTHTYRPPNTSFAPSTSTPPELFLSFCPFPLRLGHCLPVSLPAAHSLTPGAGCLCCLGGCAVVYVCMECVCTGGVHTYIHTYIHRSPTHSLTHSLSVCVCVMDVDSQPSSRGSVVCLPSLICTMRQRGAE